MRMGQSRQKRWEHLVLSLLRRGCQRGWMRWLERAMQIGKTRVAYTSADVGAAMPCFSTCSRRRSNSSGMSHFDSFVSVCPESQAKMSKNNVKERTL